MENHNRTQAATLNQAGVHNYFLYGPPGSGKTTLGQALAQNLGLPFIDLDSEIVAASGSTIPEIFARQGEAAFRKLEAAALERVLEPGERVVALGGGALLDPGLRSRTEAHGSVLCLTAPWDQLLERLASQAGQRPLLAGDPAGKLQTLLAQRGEHYASFALQLDTGDLSLTEAAWQAQVLFGTFQVSGMGRSYDVRVRPGGYAGLGTMLQLRGLKGPLALVTDENLAQLHASSVQAALKGAGYRVHQVVIPAGESYKTIETVGRLWAGFLQGGLERGSTVIALGGGVVGDLAGFAAATYLRGVRWVGLPTTLLAMVDAGLGGKTGADLPQGKNLVGAFHPPALVLADTLVLTTLPEEELRSGMAEVVKHGVIADPALFDLCALGWEGVQDHLEEIVRRAMAVKIGVIQRDPYESGERALLNLGHTLGHAIELVSDFRLRHGEAVAIGMVAAARLAERLSRAQTGTADRIAAVLQGLGLPVEVPAGMDPARVIAAMQHDKKRSGGKVRFVLPERIGLAHAGVAIADFDSLFAH